MLSLDCERVVAAMNFDNLVAVTGQTPLEPLLALGGARPAQAK
jgi:hypothetical protein